MQVDTRESWNIATRNHNAHKGDQVAFLREGGSTLFPEEAALLGSVDGLRIAHLQCNAGQDTLSLHRLGTPADLVGVDLSDVAVDFARGLSAGSGLPARFVRSDVVQWLQQTEDRFDLAFASYGTLGWLPDLAAYFAGVRRVLRPGGRYVLVEFHPLVWSFDADCAPKGDDYFAAEPFDAPVGDYVAEAGAGLGAQDTDAAPLPNPVPARSYQHTLAQQITALAGAGLVLERLEEHPHSNGARVVKGLVADGRRWVWPPGVARLPLMFSLVARRPA